MNGTVEDCSECAQTHKALANTGFTTGIATAMQQADGGNFQYVKR